MEIVCINSLRKYISYINLKPGFFTIFLSISTDPICLEQSQSLTQSCSFCNQPVWPALCLRFSLVYVPGFSLQDVWCTQIRATQCTEFTMQGKKTSKACLEFAPWSSFLKVSLTQPSLPPQDVLRTSQGERCKVNRNWWELFTSEQKGQGNEQRWAALTFLFVVQQWAKKKRIKLVVDPEYETSSTGEESAPDPSQRNRPSNAGFQPSSNGNIYIAQNGSVVRTRRVCLGNNLKATSPVRLGKQFKKLDKLAVTHEESVPLNTLSKGPSPSDKMNSRPCSVSFSSTIGAENVVTKAGAAKLKSTDEQESVVDHEEVKEPLESHSEHTQSDEEELWMGPWNNLHIPMTKLWF